MAFNNHANAPHCPCRDCFRRKIGCHGFCEPYQEWKKKVEAFRDEELRQTRVVVSDPHMRMIWRKKRYQRNLKSPVSKE